jgi:tripartite-type tricarboxylate transporter receptor subunit TctC
VAQGEAHWTLGPIAAYAGPWKAGRIRCIAVSGEKRSSIFPELPTISETVPGFRFLGWNGVMGPRAMPRAIVERLNSAIVQVLKTADARNAYAAQGEEPAWSTPEEYARLIREDYERFGKVIKQIGVKAE